MKKVLILFALLLIPSQVLGLKISNPQIVTSMRAEVTQTDTIYLSGNIQILELNFSIPQEDDYQEIEFLEVSDQRGICNTNLCSYEFVYDKFRNRLLKITWRNPQDDIELKVRSIVSVKMRRSLDYKTFPEFLLPTPLVQSTDEEIAELASKARGTDFEKVAFLSKWINQNIEYDRVYSIINLSAKEILRTKKGVCDEFSNLLVSFLRNLGYYSGVAVGFVYPGRIYTGENFQPHGWTEVYVDDGISADPTWSEVGYIDATHIKFGVFPDSSWSFGTITAKGDLSTRVLLGEMNTEIKLLNIEEKPIIDFETNLLESGVWKDYAVIKSDLSTDGCILTKVNVKSCTDTHGNEFLEIVDRDDIVYFCNKKSFFSIFKIPESIDPMSVYNCTIAVFPYAGEQKNVPLTISYRKSGDTKLTVSKTTLTPGEEVSVNAPNSHIFTDFGEYGFGNLEFLSPYNDFTVYSYNSGDLDKKKISVVITKPLEISLSSNDTVILGSNIPVNIIIRNLQNESQIVRVRFREYIETERISDNKTFVFYFTPANVEDNLIQVFVSTADYSTSDSKIVTVVKETNLLENVVQSLTRLISDFLNWLSESFKLIFK